MEKDSNKKLATLKVDGGASANNYLMQFQSDLLNVEVDRPKMIEVTAFGAALLAGIKAGIWTKSNIAQTREIDTVFSPIMGENTRKRKYKGWKKAIKRTKSK